MKYAKPTLTFEQQADQLLAHGLQANREILITRLKAVNYYRLGGYLYPFRNSDDTYKPSTTLAAAFRTTLRRITVQSFSCSLGMAMKPAMPSWPEHRWQLLSLGRRISGKTEL